MQKFILGALSVILFITLIFIISHSFLGNSKLITPFISYPMPTPTNIPKKIDIPAGNTISVTFNRQNLTIYFFEIPKGSEVTLISNFVEKEFGHKIARDHSCSLAVNGGFYTEKGLPLGLFYLDGTYFSKYEASSLATGFFWQKKNREKGIGKTTPADFADLDFIIQTGPYLAPGDYAVKLIADEKARRSLILSDGNQKLFLAFIFELDDAYLGPNLADLPRILSLPDVQNRLTVKYFLNLDGGAASFFFAKIYTDEFTLSEITPVGSVICIKD